MASTEHGTSGPHASIDVAVVTVLPEEYNAVRALLSEERRAPRTTSEPNAFAWSTGVIPAKDGSGSYRIVLALSGRPGQSSATLTTVETVRRWRPKYVLLVGIAGGLPRDGLAKGDVVFSTAIWAYEYGKLAARFIPRRDFTYQVSGPLLRAAQTLSQDWTNNIRAPSPSSSSRPKVLFGPVASGEKVIDDVRGSFFQDVLAAWPKLQAIEMEGGGAAGAIQSLLDTGSSVGFAMVRGISDMPIAALDSGQVGDEQQTAERDAWKAFASASAAAFSAQLICEALPTPPAQAAAIEVRALLPAESPRPSPIERLALEMKYRREFGDPFAIVLGSGCSIASDYYAALRQDLSGTQDYLGYRHALARLPEQARLERLRSAIESAELSPGFQALGRLVARGWFRLVVTFGPVRLVERALRLAGVDASEVETTSIEDSDPLKLVGLLDRLFPRVKLLHSPGVVNAGGAEQPESSKEVLRVLARRLRRGALFVGLEADDPAPASFLMKRGDSVWLCSVHWDPEEVGPLLRERGGSENTWNEAWAQFDPLLCGIEDQLAMPEALSIGGDPVLSIDPVSSAVEAESPSNARHRADRLTSLQLQLEAELTNSHLAASDERRGREREREQRQERLRDLRSKIEVLSHAGEGTILGEFKVLDKLGSGSSGSVYRATHLLTKAEVAVKVLDRIRADDPNTVARFFRGARITSSMDHPNIVRIADLGGRNGLWCYYAMEFVDGPNLEALIAADCLSSAERWNIGRSVVDAIAYAHTRFSGSPVLHRDVKPANVLVTRDCLPKVSDFEAGFLETASELSRTASVPLGTAFYLAPELELNPTIAAQRQTSVDVFALGRLLLRLFSGIAPRETIVGTYLRDTEALRLALSHHANGAALNYLVAMIQGATNGRPENRFSSAQKLLEVYDKAQGAIRKTRRRSLSKTGIRLRPVSRGEFTMGAPDSSRRVCISEEFEIADAPITVRCWNEVWGHRGPADDDRPIENISWFSALSFCNALSSYAGLPLCYELDDDGITWHRERGGFRLPTEAEWEFTCRAGTTTTYYNGDADTDLDLAAWSNQNCNDGPMPVRLLEPNALDLYDMLGNVWEWCWDYFAPYPPEETVSIDPAGPEFGELRVLRGGSWRRSPHHCTCRNRYDGDPRNGGRSLGLRVVRTKSKTA